MGRPKLSCEFISKSLKETIPEYEEMLIYIEQNGGWISLPPKMAELIDKLKIHNYPELYRSEEIFIKMLLLAFMPAEQINELGAKFKLMSQEEQVCCSEELIQFMGESTDTILENLRDAPENELDANKEFGELKPEEQAEFIKQAQISMSAFFAAFFNTISIMVHGRKITDLVEAAERGDDDAYCLAVQIDKRICRPCPISRNVMKKQFQAGKWIS